MLGQEFVVPHLDQSLTKIWPLGKPLRVFDVPVPWLPSKIFPEPSWVPTVNQNSTFPVPVFHVNVVVGEMVAPFDGLVN